MTNTWTAEDTRRWYEERKKLFKSSDFPVTEDPLDGFLHMGNLLAERDALVLHIQDFLNFTPGWAESKLFKALPEYLRKEIEDAA